MVGLYSLQVTHLHHNVKSSLEYPKSQVERPALLDGKLPDLSATVSFHVSYYIVQPDPDVSFLVGLPRLTPQGRAPPLQHS